LSRIGYKPKFREVVRHFRFAPNSRHSWGDVRFRADFVGFALNSRPKWVRRIGFSFNQPLPA
jgi:hypothetical protein